MKFFIAAVFLILVFVMPVSTKVKNTAKVQKQTITGYLVDMNCASMIVKGAKDKIEKKAKRHTRECNLDEMCAAAGYTVISNGTVVRLNDAGNTMALAYCKSIAKKDNIRVDVVGVLSGDILAVESIHDAAAE